MPRATGSLNGISRKTPKPNAEHADGKDHSACENHVNARIWCKVIFTRETHAAHLQSLLIPLSSWSLRRSKPSTFISIARQLCPRCRSGKIFRSSIYWGLPKMHDRCPNCSLRFNREPGYFLGAMYISYGIALVLIVALGAALWVLTQWRIDRVAIVAMVLFLPLVPMLTLLSRVLWIYLDQKIDPEIRTG